MYHPFMLHIIYRELYIEVYVCLTKNLEIALIISAMQCQLSIGLKKLSQEQN